MHAVLSSEPLTKRSPSGSSARQHTMFVWCGKMRYAVVDVEEPDGLVARAAERALVVGQRHDGIHRGGVQKEGVLEGSVY